MENANNFEYRGWHVQLEVTRSGSTFSISADLRLQGQQKCRLVLSTTREDLVSAQWALDSKVRDYIDNYLTRAHTGTTSFGGLEEDWP